MRQRWIKASASPFLIVLGLMIATGPVDAHHAVLRFNLEEMTAAADRIFVGTCVAVEESVNTIAQGEMPVTSYTFEVERAVKGKLPRRLTFRQLGHPSHRAIGKGGELTAHGHAVNSDSFIHGMSEYRPGDRVLLFLIPNYLGGRITYPVGLYQGAFFISRMPSGRELARNAINNLGLFTANYNGTAMARTNARLIFPERENPVPEAQGLSAASQRLSVKRGALPLDALLELVGRINIAHGRERGTVASTPKGGAIQ